MDSSGNLLLLAHTFALCMSMVGGSGRIPILVPGEVFEEFHTGDSVQNTLTGGSEYPGNADLLVCCPEKGVHLFTPPV